MTPEQLQAIKQRFERATPGPWHVWNGYTVGLTAQSGTYAAERIGPAYTGDENPWYGLFGGDMSIEGRVADMEFVAHAWEDIAALLEALEGLEELDQVGLI